jgi:hypothetical protein
VVFRSEHGFQKGTNMKNELLGWRDKRISQRHRLWGVNVPALDLDFPVLEYDGGKPAALIDYKYCCANVDVNNPSLRALTILASNSLIPALVVRYDPDEWLFTLFPLNREAKALCRPYQVMCECEFVSFLYQIRGRFLPLEIMSGLLDYPEDMMDWKNAKTTSP